MDTEQGIAARLNAVRERIAEICAACGRDPEDVRLIAVSKTMPPAAIEEAYAAGQRDFGENRIQELTDKAPQLPDDIRWHMIGHLQRNKAREAIDTAALIHSVDRTKLLDRIEFLAAEAGVVQNVLIEANISGEGSKFGVDLTGLDQLVARTVELEHVKLRGFMTMAPLYATAPELHGIFGALREYRDGLDIGAPELSMGMSRDYHVAIEEGATMIRVGTAIFGDREA